MTSDTESINGHSSRRRRLPAGTVLSSDPNLPASIESFGAQTPTVAVETSGSTGLSDSPLTDEGDDRGCPHCYGSLVIVEANEDGTHYRYEIETIRDHEQLELPIVVCYSCHTTPSGVFLSPKSRGRSQDDSGGTDRVGHRSDGNVERYRHSEQIRCAGGYEPPYDEDDAERPVGVTAEYTFDLTTY